MLELPAWWFEDEEWRGFVLRDSSASLLHRHVFATWLAGFNHRREVARLPSFDPGQPLVPVPDPGNPHDPNAIAIFDAEEREKAGFVPAVIASGLQEAQRFGLSLAEHLEGGERVGLEIVISREPLVLRTVVTRPDDAEVVRLKVRRSERGFQRASREAQPPSDPLEQMRRMMEGLEDRP